MQVTHYFEPLPGQQYFLQIPLGTESELLNTVIGSLWDQQPRFMILPDGTTIPVPELKWEQVNPEEYYSSMEDDQFISLGIMIRIPPVHVLLNSLERLIVRGETELSSAKNRIGKAALKEFSRMVQQELLKWVANPAVRGHIERLDQLSRDEVGISPIDGRKMGIEDGQVGEVVRYPVASSKSLKEVVIRLIHGVRGIALRSDVIEDDLMGDVDGDPAAVWIDPKDKGKRFERPLREKKEDWGNFRSEVSLNTVFYNNPDRITAMEERREKNNIGPATKAAWILARVLALGTREVQESYKTAFDTMGQVFERCFDARKGNGPMLNVDQLISALYGTGRVDAAALREHGINPDPILKAMAISRGNLISYASQSPAFRAFVVQNRAAQSALDVIQAAEDSKIPYEQIAQWIQDEMSMKNLKREGE
jgi:hypothetical protein